MKHFHRRKLVKELIALYHDNFKDSENWSFQKMEQMKRYYSIVKEKVHPESTNEAERPQNELEGQLDLFS